MCSDSGIEIAGAGMGDLDALCAIEEACFPQGMAASREAFSYRLSRYPRWFLKAAEGGAAIGLVNGCPSARRHITDDLYLPGGDFNEGGDGILIFGLAVLPAYRGRGVARALLGRILELARDAGKRRASLTCEERLIGFYEGLGFSNSGVSESVVGGVRFFDMDILL